MSAIRVRSLSPGVGDLAAPISFLFLQEQIEEGIIISDTLKP